MELTRPGYAVVYVILLCALAQGGSEGKRAEDDDFSREYAAVFSSSLHAYGKQADVVWNHCRKELAEGNNGAKDLDFHAPEGSNDMRSIFLIENNINKATKSLSPHMTSTFLDCIRASNTPLAPVSEQEASSRYLSPSGHGRYLIFKEPASDTGPSLVSDPISRDKDLSLPRDMFVSVPPPPPPPLRRRRRRPRAAKLFRPKTDARIASPPGKIASPPGNVGVKVQQRTIYAACALGGIIMLIGMCLCYRQVKSSQAEKDNGPQIISTPQDYSSGSPKVFRSGNPDPKKEYGIKNETKTSNVRSGSIKAKDSSNTSQVERTSSKVVGQVPESAAAKPAPPPPGPPPPPAPRPPALGPKPPPPPRAGHRPVAPPKPMAERNQPGPEQGGSSDGDASKPKLKPFFWDKVAAIPDQSMVWHEIGGGSFVFNEEKMASLFGCTNQNRNERKKDSLSLDTPLQYIQIIDPKKAQNLSILLRALNVTTDEVIDALKEGHEIPIELIQTLLKMAPTAEEELKLRLFTGELSQLGPAERFLKVLVDIPFAFKRLESLLLMFILPEEASSIKECFATLEVSCNKLRKSRLFLKLLEAVLKTGNRMNDGTYRGGAQAFRLDTLLKLSDVKGTDGKTTLLHFVVQEIIRSEGIRAARTTKESSNSMSSVKTEDFVDECEESGEHYRSLGLEVVSGLSSELDDVKKAAIIEGDALSAAVSKLNSSLTKTREFLNSDLKNLEEETEFKRCMERFAEKAESEVKWLVDEEKRIMALVKSTADYFHGTAGKDEGLRLFLIVRDFLIILDNVCKEVKNTTMKAAKASSLRKEPASSMPSSPDDCQQNLPPSDMHRRLFPAIAGRRMDYDSCSDDDDDFSS